MKKINLFFRNNIWTWSALGSLFLWLIMGVFSHHLNIQSLISNAFAASFVGMLSIGQMLVITSGRGAVDLSIAGVITLSALVSMKIIDGSNSNVILAFVILLIIGVIVGLFNSILIIFLKMPAMIATMATNYILTTVSLFVNRDFAVFKVAPFLENFILGKFLGINLMIYFVLILVVIFWIVLNKTTYGYQLSAVGQNRAASRLSGVSINKVEISTYVLCSVLAAYTGMFLAARVGGAVLGMGDRYVNETLASVVLGGTSISGGKANIIGIIFGSLFLSLVVTAMQVLGLSVGIQNVVKGVLLVFVLLLSFDGKRKK